jgi:hypothetical protein
MAESLSDENKNKNKTTFHQLKLKISKRKLVDQKTQFQLSGLFASNRDW